MRFPKKALSGNASLSLNIQFSNNRRMVINLLTGKVSGAKTLKNVPNQKNKKWQNFILDLKKLYQQRFKNKSSKGNMKDIYIRSLMRDARNLKSKEILDLSLFTIFKKFKISDKITINGYDKSGIKGIEWKLTDAKGKEIKSGKVNAREFKLALLPGSKSIQLLKLALRDKAGKLASPMLFPIVMDPPPPPPPSFKHEYILSEEITFTEKPKPEPQPKLEKKAEPKKISKKKKVDKKDKKQ